VDFIRQHLASYALGLLLIVIASFVAQLGFFVFCIGIFPASFWAACVIGYVIGGLAKLDEGRPGETASRERWSGANPFSAL
jgi:hypothetical protein